MFDITYESVTRLRRAFIEMDEQELVDIVKMKVANAAFKIITHAERNPMLTDEQQVAADINGLEQIASWPIVRGLKHTPALEVMNYIVDAQEMLQRSVDAEPIYE